MVDRSELSVGIPLPLPTTSLLQAGFPQVDTPSSSLQVVGHAGFIHDFMNISRVCIIIPPFDHRLHDLELFRWANNSSWLENWHFYRRTETCISPYTLFPADCKHCMGTTRAILVLLPMYMDEKLACCLSSSIRGLEENRRHVWRTSVLVEGGGVLRGGMLHWTCTCRPLS